MITVVKIGGNVIDNPAGLQAFLEQFASLGEKCILVHGGGKIATRMGEKLGIPSTMINGRRVTSPETLNVVTMVYAGLVNKNIVARLLPLGCKALGMCGADGSLIISARRSPVPVDYGEVGDVTGVDTSTLRSILEAGMVPVICSITTDGQGNLLNTNADSVAAAIAGAAATIEPTRLVYCFEKPGVLLDVDDDSSVVPFVNEEIFASLKSDGKVHQGMLPKLENALASVRGGVSEVVIKSSMQLADPGAGTKIGI